MVAQQADIFLQQDFPYVERPNYFSLFLFNVAMSNVFS